MKGFELSERFFHEIGLPAIEQQLPRCIPKLAVGVGLGSQAHKNDDDVSRDHGWGPGFTVWLAKDDFDDHGERLQEILDTLPHEYDGFRWQKPKFKTCIVIEISSYIKSIVGFSEPPQSPVDWLRIPEPHLFELTPSRLYRDGPGIVSARFRAFSKYPDDVWKQRMGACLSWCWEWGRKHLFRAEARGDHVSACCYWTRFAEYAMKVGFLMSQRYAPYHKWLWTEFRRLGTIADKVSPLLEEGFEKVNGKRELVDRIEMIYMEKLQQLGFSPTGRVGTAYPDNELHQYAQGVRSTIEDPEVKKLRLGEEIAYPATRAAWTWLR